MTDNETVGWIIPFKYFSFLIYVYIYNFWFHSKWNRVLVSEQILTFNSETLYLWSHLISCSNPKLECYIGNELHFLLQKDVYFLLTHLGQVHAHHVHIYTLWEVENWNVLITSDSTFPEIICFPFKFYFSKSPNWNSYLWCLENLEKSYS